MSYEIANQGNEAYSKSAGSIEIEAYEADKARRLTADELLTWEKDSPLTARMLDLRQADWRASDHDVLLIEINEEVRLLFNVYGGPQDDIFAANFNISSDGLITLIEDPTEPTAQPTEIEIGYLLRPGSKLGASSNDQAGSNS